MKMCSIVTACLGCLLSECVGGRNCKYPMNLIKECIYSYSHVWHVAEISMNIVNTKCIYYLQMNVQQWSASTPGTALRVDSTLNVCVLLGSQEDNVRR